MIVKEVNRTVTLKSTNVVEPSKNDVVISIMADLQQQQDRETERQLKHMTEMVSLCQRKLHFPLCDSRE